MAPVHRPRNESLDPIRLIGLDWSEAAYVIRNNGWCCRLIDGESAAVPPDIDCARFPPQRPGQPPTSLWVTLKNGRIISALIVYEL
jgi:hypothetical protein